MKKSLALVGSLLVTGSVFAGISSNIGLTSNYVWRGQTQTAAGPAVQGGMDYSHDVGAFAGLWISNAANSETETDLYLGYSRELVAGLKAKVQLTQYDYRKAAAIDTQEGTFALSYKFLNLSVSYTDDYFATKSSDLYTNLSGSYEVLKDLALGAAVGYTSFGDETKAGSKNYVDYKVSATHTIEKFSVSANYSDTNRDNAAGVEQDDRAVFITLSRVFE